MTPTLTLTPPATLTLTRPDDWHLHLRDGAGRCDGRARGEQLQRPAGHDRAQGREQQHRDDTG